MGTMEEYFLQRKLHKLAEYYKDDMIRCIENDWDDNGGPELSMPDAETYLGHSTKGMTPEEVDEEVSELQLAYYTSGEATLDEIIDKFIAMEVDNEEH